jgi:hypothetical protein
LRRTTRACSRAARRKRAKLQQNSFLNQVGVEKQARNVAASSLKPFDGEFPFPEARDVETGERKRFDQTADTLARKRLHSVDPTVRKQAKLMESAPGRVVGSAVPSR